MGRAMKRVTVKAGSPESAVIVADRLGLPALGLPGTVPQAASKSRVLGITEVRS